MLSKDLPNKELGLDDMVDTPHQANTDNLWLDDMLDTNKWKESKAEESTETESKSEDAKEGEGVEPEESTEDKSEWDKEPKDLLWWRAPTHCSTTSINRYCFYEWKE